LSLKKYIDMLIAKGYQKGALFEQIAHACGLNTGRSVKNWLTGNSTPDVYRGQIVAKYLSQKLNMHISVSDLWPVQDLREVI
jgi:hypothetical protein